MSGDDEVHEHTPGEDRATASSDAPDEAVTAPALQGPGLSLNEEVRAYLLGMVTDLEELGGIGLARIREIAYGDEATNDELEELGYVFVQLLHALVASAKTSRPPVLGQ